MMISRCLSTITIAVVLALPIVALSDYVADDSEIAAMKAKILKNPPTAETLTAPPYPGSQLDAECSADQSATNQADPMVYCLYKGLARQGEGIPRRTGQAGGVGVRVRRQG